jgi:hypothetical protein
MSTILFVQDEPEIRRNIRALAAGMNLETDVYLTKPQQCS